MKEKMKFYVSYIGYVRYGQTEPVGVKVYFADSTKEALKAIIEEHSYPLDEDDEDKNVAWLMKFLESNNGDGCDYVISIISDNGTLIFACEIYTDKEEKYDPSNLRYRDDGGSEQ
jgi:hypothetical protein